MTIFTKFRAVLATVATVLSIASTASAELPPGAYDELRAHSEEALIVRVERVRVEALPRGGSVVEAEAVVVAVQRSKAGLTKGARVTIRYGITPREVPGQSQVPLLQAGEFYPAFLSKAVGGSAPSRTGPGVASTYVPVAYGASFNMTPFGTPPGTNSGSGNDPVPPPAPGPSNPVGLDGRGLWPRLCQGRGG